MTSQKKTPAELKAEAIYATALDMIRSEDEVRMKKTQALKAARLARDAEAGR